MQVGPFEVIQSCSAARVASVPAAKLADYLSVSYLSSPALLSFGRLPPLSITFAETVDNASESNMMIIMILLRSRSHAINIDTAFQ